jgi:hypothetical protein
MSTIIEEATVPPQVLLTHPPLATSKSPTFGHPKSPRQDG